MHQVSKCSVDRFIPIPIGHLAFLIRVLRLIWASVVAPTTTLPARSTPGFVCKWFRLGMDYNALDFPNRLSQKKRNKELFNVSNVKGEIPNLHKNLKQTFSELSHAKCGTAIEKLQKETTNDHNHAQFTQLNRICSKLAKHNLQSHGTLQSHRKSWTPEASLSCVSGSQKQSQRKLNHRPFWWSEHSELKSPFFVVTTMPLEIANDLTVHTWLKHCWNHLGYFWALSALDSIVVGFQALKSECIQL